MQDQPSSAENFWSKVLGIDRLKLSPGGQVGIEWHNIAKEDVGWFVALVVIPLVLVLAWLVYRKERKDVAMTPKLVLAGLRAGLYLLVALMLMGPILTVEISKIRKSFVLVLIDDSLSMRKSDPPSSAEEKRTLAEAVGMLNEKGELPADVDEQFRKLSRAEVVKRVLNNPKYGILDKIEEKLNVAYFTFSKGARAMEDRARWNEEYRVNDAGTETAIGEAMTQALSIYKGQLVSAIVVVSDGKNNFGIDPSRVAKQLKQRFVPVYTMIAGIPQKEKDIALLEPEGREAVLANDHYNFKLNLKSHGFEGQNADVSLYIVELKDATEKVDMDPAELEKRITGLTPEKTESVVMEGNKRKQPVDFVFTPKKPGEYLLVIKTPPREDERTELNNYIGHRLRVADDKIKVLYVEHPPRYEYRFLKSALIRDEKILVHCFLTSADPDFVQEKSAKAEDPLFKEPLKEWPKDLKTLLNYDVIVLGDVDLGKLGDPKKVGEDLEKFVSSFGGGIVFMSGTVNNPRTFVGTPLERLLPVIPEERRGGIEDVVYDKDFGYKLTDEAKIEGGHPIIRFPALGADIAKIIEQWEDNDQRADGLPGARWCAPVSKVKPGARTLVQLTNVPGREGPDQRPPAFVTQNYGYGRVFWSGIDETHRWRYLVGDSPWFYPFWQAAMYWVREGKLLGARRYRLRVDRHDKRYMTGDTVNFFASAFDRDFNPLTDAEIELNVEPLEGERIKVKLQLEREGGVPREGYYTGSFLPKSVGLYRAWVGEEDESTRATEKFTVFIPNREEEEPILDEEQLKDIAKQAAPQGGEANYFPLSRVADLPDAIQRSEQKLVETKEDDLWDSPLVYLVFALIITAEWVLRKIFRML
jgi:hypothetical protein